MDALTHPALYSPALTHGFFTRKGGVSEGVFSSLNCAHGTGDAAEKVDENFKRIANAMHVPQGNVLKAWQIHGSEVAVATHPWSLENRPKADAIVTATPGLCIGVTTADCAPVLFADLENRIIACAHAGWKGALSGVIQVTVECMERLSAERTNIIAVVGPCIQQPSYEVGAEFYEKFIENNQEHRRFFVPAADLPLSEEKGSGKAGHFLFNLPAFVRNQLEKSGIRHINSLANDTRLEEDHFFSYRRTTLNGENAYGCQYSAIALKE